MKKICMQRNIVSISIICLGLLTLAQPSSAANSDAQGRSWFGKVGSASIKPNDSSGEISGPGLPPGNGVGIGNATQVAFSVGRYLSDHVAVELILSLPFEHDIAAKGSIAGLGKIGTTQHLPPTVFLQYRFMQPTDVFRPYIGIGANYTKFLDEKATGALEAALGGTTSINLKASTGLAVEAGFDFDLDRNLFLNVAVARVKIATTATIDTPAVGTRRMVGVTVDPWIGMFALGYRF